MTKAIYDYWEYFEPIRQYGPPDCITTIQKLVNVADKILIGRNDSQTTEELKTVFQLGNLT